jgi:cysteine desulfurase / selenocysteine lyase
VHRGAHTLSAEATDAYEAARTRVARFINAPDERSVVFVRNATEGINLVAHAWGRHAVGPGDEIVVTVAEHHANLVPWHLLAAERGAVVRGVPLGSDQRVDLDALKGAMSPRTKLVATFHVSNVLGVLNPIEAIAGIAHEAGALLLVDGAQAVPHLPVDVQALGADMYAFSGHKVGAPSGIGALWVRAELLAAWPPFMGGGEMIRTVTVDRSTYADIPMRFEAGTPAIAEAVGLHAALDYLDEVGLQEIWDHDRALARYAIERLRGVDGITLYGPEGDDRGGIVTFNLDGVHPHDVASALDVRGVAIRAGHHCAQPLMGALGVRSTARASFWIHTTTDEIDLLADALGEVRTFFAGVA